MKRVKAVKGEKNGKPAEPASLAHLRVADPILYAASLPFAEEILARKGHRRSYKQLFDSLAGAIVGAHLFEKTSVKKLGRGKLLTLSGSA
jgi:hypothetical protein